MQDSEGQFNLMIFFFTQIYSHIVIFQQICAIKFIKKKNKELNSLTKLLEIIIFFMDI